MIFSKKVGKIVQCGQNVNVFRERATDEAAAATGWRTDWRRN